MLRSVVAALVCISLTWTCAHVAFVGSGPPQHMVTEQTRGVSHQFLAASPSSAEVGAAASSQGFAIGGALGVAAVALGMSALRRSSASRRAPSNLASIAMCGADNRTVRERLIACHAQLRDAGLPSVEEADKQMHELEAMAKTAIAGGVAGLAFLTSMPDPASAYPVYAQQNFADPVTANGKIVCANCHLAKKDVVIRGPHDVLPDTIFKVQIQVPCKYDKRVQPQGDGSKGPLNIGAVVVFPDGWKLAPRDRLPKALKKEMKGLSWSPYSAEKPNIFVVGPVPGSTFENMIVPVLAPIPDNKVVYFDKILFSVGANRGRGQIYPDGKLTNNNVYTVKEASTVKAIETVSSGDPPVQTSVITVEGKSGTEKIEVGAGADIIVEVGDQVAKDGQLTTNPNVGGFGQDERDLVLQSVDRVNAVQALMTSICVAQLAFVLKKKQFEKVQLAEGF